MRHELFHDAFISKLARTVPNSIDRSPENIISYIVNNRDAKELSEYIKKDYSILRSMLKNSLLSRLYSGLDKNWFDIENIYFQELIPIKDKAITNIKSFDIQQLDSLNTNFLEIKSAVIDYLKTVDIIHNPQIENFLKLQCKNCQKAYFINFNYTSSVQNYIVNSERFVVNHIHGNLSENNIIFGYGNDQDDHYQQMKELGIEQFLDFF